MHVSILQFICFSSKKKQWDLRVVNRSQALTGLSSPRAPGRDHYPLTQEEVAGGGVGKEGLQMRDLAPNQGPLRTYLMQTTHPLFSSAPMFPEYCLSFIVPKHQVSSHPGPHSELAFLHCLNYGFLFTLSTNASQLQWACEFPRTSIQSS